ncbi:putative serine/threonine-protein kinase Cx32 chloroplastic-like, partial [Trifolium medium]|nr:putative serine/threonine-protein kinase Cx32 chloroplastic-like [Trifolium medium]
MKSATRNFRPENVLGEGGFGTVFKGLIKEGAKSKKGEVLTIAIKILNSHSLQGLAEWQSEVNFLGRLSHPNLVKLLGFGREDGKLFLV